MIALQYLERENPSCKNDFWFGMSSKMNISYIGIRFVLDSLGGADRADPVKAGFRVHGGDSGGKRSSHVSARDPRARAQHQSKSLRHHRASIDRI